MNTLPTICPECNEPLVADGEWWLCPVCSVAYTDGMLDLAMGDD